MDLGLWFARGLLVVGHGLFLVCLCFAACGSFLCCVPCVPWCPLVFPRVPCVSFFCALPVPMPRQVYKSLLFKTFVGVFSRWLPDRMFLSFLVFFVSFLTPFWEVFGSLFRCFFDVRKRGGPEEVFGGLLEPSPHESVRSIQGLLVFREDAPFGL